MYNLEMGDHSILHNTSHDILKSKDKPQKKIYFIDHIVSPPPNKSPNTPSITSTIIDKKISCQEKCLMLKDYLVTILVIWNNHCMRVYSI